LNSQFGAFFQEKVSLPGKTPNHLKFRILERGTAVLKRGLKISFGLFISAEYKRSQNPDNYAWFNFTCYHPPRATPGTSPALPARGWGIV